ncbi:MULTISPECIES: acetyl-CoA hydrolase/transferase family protein [unclassified Pseudofrankia]|uniref:acetyl-CoA hydrolase/transferase family protein n=1 Tax=unclassified Pseudofrankia TaxID=2994372 RepID=UPI0008DAEFFD|nr:MULTISPECIES: acetyl-CoA hydrolase/transferase C-terminal domain-containing protein [unclassified Pseudofrankia]MDT3444678.1 acetyl-CoA hydrolase/transferase C-terminal domain-containing protein [Pseudofrankia sp. BMG5.37]OHV66581.1 hypothetical protein BCD48_35870 [Pseudofrankia sp. BMG5.36]
MSDSPQVVSADEAMRAVQSGMLVATGSLSSEPVVLLEALAQRARSVGALTLLGGMLLDGYRAMAPELGASVRLNTWFMPGTSNVDAEMGPAVDFLPMSWSQTCRYVEGADIDVALVQVSPADADGNHSFGISSSLTPLLARRATVVIAHVNPRMPFTLGDSLIHESEIDFVVMHEAPLRAYPHRTPGPLDAEIGCLVADLIPNGATIQCGIGTVPEAVCQTLVDTDRTDLRITGMLTDGGRALIESGRCMSDGPAAVVGEVVGSPDLYRWVDRNPAVNLQNGLHTHSLEALARWERFVSINSTLEIDLYGQLNSEVLRGGQAGGIGGSVDFMLGAQLAGNMSIVALPSTTVRGASRIVPVLSKGLVTVPRTLVQHVVTEYGVADLRFLSAGERAEALAGISHPDHREGLFAAAKKLPRTH